MERNLPLRAFVTLTLPHNISRLRLDSTFARWIEAIQAENRLTLGWIKAYENDPSRHAHAVLLAAAPLDCFRAETLWMQINGVRSRMAARVEKYRVNIGGLAYVMKSLDRNSEDIQFSHNLSAFVPGAGGRFFGVNAAERRQKRRIERAIVANDNGGQ